MIVKLETAKYPHSVKIRHFHDHDLRGCLGCRDYELDPYRGIYACWSGCKMQDFSDKTSKHRCKDFYPKGREYWE